jgi:hypothetical protein
VLVCHADSRLNREGIARWLASFTDLVGMILVEEGRSQTWARARREVKRVGPVRFLDVIAFRVYYRLVHARADARWLTDELRRLAAAYGDLPTTPEVLRTGDPSSPQAEAFLRRLAPDLMVARCKRILKERVFAIPRTGTFVLHPGVCPEYRNAHGAFWALAERDLGNVGLTLLKVDRGVDTGPVYGYYSCDFDEASESPLVIMVRLALENLDRLRDKLLEIHRGVAVPLDTRGRPSKVWGQPWLTRYLRWKREARMGRPHARAVARVP